MIFNRDDLNNMNQLLARNILKDPYTNAKTGTLSCPNCNSDQILYHSFIKFPKYCVNCGQALSWESLKGIPDDN